MRRSCALQAHQSGSAPLSRGSWPSAGDTGSEVAASVAYGSPARRMTSRRPSAASRHGLIESGCDARASGAGDGGAGRATRTMTRGPGSAGPPARAAARLTTPAPAEALRARPRWPPPRRRPRRRPTGRPARRRPVPRRGRLGRPRPTGRASGRGRRRPGRDRDGVLVARDRLELGVGLGDRVVEAVVALERGPQRRRAASRPGRSRPRLDGGPLVEDVARPGRAARVASSNCHARIASRIGARQLPVAGRGDHVVVARRAPPARASSSGRSSVAGDPRPPQVVERRRRSGPRAGRAGRASPAAPSHASPTGAAGRPAGTPRPAAAASAQTRAAGRPAPARSAIGPREREAGGVRVVLGGRRPRDPTGPHALSGIRAFCERRRSARRRRP